MSRSMQAAWAAQSAFDAINMRLGLTYSICPACIRAL
jgi:hypothetical protein